MQAIIRTKAGKEFSTMKVQNIESPKTQSGELKVKMVSSRINPVDMDLMKDQGNGIQFALPLD